MRVRLCQRVLPAGSPGGAEPHTPRETGQKQRGEGPAAPTVSSHTPAPDKPLQRRASPTRLLLGGNNRHLCAWLGRSPSHRYFCADSLALADTPLGYSVIYSGAHS